MTLDELKTTHAAAGAAYQSAIEQLRAAYIELAALDQVLSNGGIGNDDAPNVRTFNGLAQNASPFIHPKFAPHDDHREDWRDAIAARRDQLLKSFGN